MKEVKIPEIDMTPEKIDSILAMSFPGLVVKRLFIGETYAEIVVSLPKNMEYSERINRRAS